VKISKPYFLFVFWLAAAFWGVVVPMACTNTSSNFVPTGPATPVVVSATPTNAFGLISTPTFTIQPTGTSTNTPVVTPITGTPICTPNVPNALAVNGSFLFVAGGDGNLSIYPIGGGNAVTTINQFSLTGASFTALSGVAVDSNGKLYVLDSGASATSIGTVYEFDSTSNPVTAVTSWNNFNGVTIISPQGIAVDNNLNVYVTDTGNNEIDEFSANGVTAVNQWGFAGNGNGNFNYPAGIATNGTGASVTIFVADMDNELIQVFNSTGGPITQFSTPAEPPNVPGVMGIVVDGSGDVFTADYGNSYIEDYNSTSSPGTFNAQWNGPSGSPNLFGPTGVALNSTATTLYLSDYDNNAIYAITP
jgi:tripartite motif-containing protein 71